MAIDPKYGKVTLEHGTIGEDEPVIVFRATDEILPRLLVHYHSLCDRAGSPPRHLGMILNARQTVMAWQAENPTRIPTSENSREWMV